MSQVTKDSMFNAVNSLLSDFVDTLEECPEELRDEFIDAYKAQLEQVLTNY